MRSAPHLLAAALYLASAASWAQTQDAENVPADSPTVEEGRDGQAQNSRDPAKDFSLPIRIVEDPEEAERAKRRAEDAAQRERDDLAAQQSMAESTEWIVVVSWWQLGLATAGTFLVFGSLGLAAWSNRTAVIALREAKRIGEAQTRAYVYARKAKLIYEDGFWVNIYLHNSGQTPAKYFKVGCISYIRKYGTGDSALIPENLPSGYWTGLSAGTTDTVAQHPPELRQHIRQLNDGPPSDTLVIAGRVIYGDVFDDEWESEFAFFIRQPVLTGKLKMSRSVARLKAYHKRHKTSGQSRAPSQDAAP